jgi:hypothetical protein
VKRTKGLRLTELPRPKWRWKDDVLPRHVPQKFPGLDEDEDDFEEETNGTAKAEAVVARAKLALEDPEMWLKGASLFRAGVQAILFPMRLLKWASDKRLAAKEAEIRETSQMMQVRPAMMVRLHRTSRKLPSTGFVRNTVACRRLGTLPGAGWRKRWQLLCIRW